MNKLLITTILLFAINAAQGQTSDTRKSITSEIDSICKANKISVCNLYFRAGDDKLDTPVAFKSTWFKFDGNFLIIDDSNFYNVNNLIYFTIDVFPGNERRNLINIFLRGY